MAQQGGTNLMPAASYTSRPADSPQATKKAENKTDTAEWEIVPGVEDRDKEAEHSKETSTHFDIQVGVGKWKWTIFSYDKTTTRAGKHG